MVDEVKNEFGRMLRLYRHRSEGPKGSRGLTQERLAELLEYEAKVAGYTGPRVSNWERGKEIIRHDNRKLLIGLIKVLYLYGGIRTLDEADSLLRTGNYRTLDEPEILQINESWTQANEGSSLVDDGRFSSATPYTRRPQLEPDRSNSSQQRQPKSVPTNPFLVPFRRNPDFVGREAELVALHELIQRVDSPVGIRPPVLVGLGGIGKTQLTIEYAYRYREHYPDGVFWLNGSNPLLNEFASLAEVLGLVDKEASRERAAYQAWGFLDVLPSALVIFDNIPEAAALNIPFSLGLIPANLRCCTLFTTRQRVFPREFQPFEVKVLPETAAMSLLLRSRQEINHTSHPDWGIARIICASLGWLPLALEMAAAWLEVYPDVTLAGYLERLRTEGGLATIDDTDLRPEDLPTRHEAAVAATLHTQWSVLTDENAKLIFRAAGQLQEGELLPLHRLGLLTGVSAVCEPGYSSSLTQAVKKLQVASLIEELTNNRLRLHPLVREFASTLSPATFRLEMATRLAQLFFKFPTLENQVRLVGIDAVLTDLRVGLWLCVDRFESSSTYKKLAGLEQVVDREAHNLRQLSLEWDPVFLVQQIHNQAKERGLSDIMTSAAARLNQFGHPHLILHWRGSVESGAFIRTLSGHLSEATCLALTPDDQCIVSAANDGNLKIWNLHTGQTSRTLIGHAKRIFTARPLKPEDMDALHLVNAVAVTPDGRSILSASNDHTLKIWDLPTGQEVRTLMGHTDAVWDVAVTSDGQLAISASADRSLKVWRLATGEVVHTLTGHLKTVHAVAVIPDSYYAVSVSQDNTLKIWDIQSGQVVYTFVDTGSPHLCNIAITPDSRLAVTGYRKGILKIWNLETRRVEKTISAHQDRIFALAITPDGRHVISAGADRTIKVWELSTGQEKATLTGHGHWIRGLAVTTDGQYIVSAANDRLLKVWNLSNSLSGSNQGSSIYPVTSVITRQDATQGISVSYDGTLKLWSLQTGRLIKTLLHPNHNLRVVAIAPNGQTIVTGAFKGMIDVWDGATGKIVKTLIGHSKDVEVIEVLQDGRHILSASADATIRTWDLQTGRSVKVLTGHRAAVMAFSLSSDNRRMTSASYGEQFKQWDLDEGVEIATFAPEKAADVTAIAVYQAIAVTVTSTSSLRVWDLRTDQLSREFRLRHQGLVMAVALVGDGRYAISVSEDHFLKIWDIHKGVMLAQVAAEAGLRCVTVSFDGSFILTGDEVGNVYCWQCVGIDVQNLAR